MDELSRQAAVDAAEFGMTYVKMINKETGEVIMQFEQSNKELLKATDRIKELPPVERKKGKWKYEGCDTYSCPFCGDTHVDDGNIYYFCKVCGADMRGE